MSNEMFFRQGTIIGHWSLDIFHFSFFRAAVISQETFNESQNVVSEQPGEQRKFEA
jgi:hypothetical protein